MGDTGEQEVTPLELFSVLVFVFVFTGYRLSLSTWQDRLNQQTGSNLARNAVFVLLR